MRRKVSTILDESLYRRVRVESARQGKQISEILGEAVESYLGESARSHGAGVVAETWGVLNVDRRKLDKILEEEGLVEA